ncbi:unnamed protein product [Rhizoctonia solani]|uniref:CHAT domain-containing protein n=1 Tax=Rhizoctonia solani TaxID=456999 RepID=A0A8H3DTX5_9AGAM|nr:unnamed protein product [Rhizoctonia solani]
MIQPPSPVDERGTTELSGGGCDRRAKAKQKLRQGRKAVKGYSEIERWNDKKNPYEFREQMTPKVKERIDREIASLTRELSQTPDDRPDALRVLLAHLAKSHVKIFNIRCDLGDLEKSIEYGSTALTLTPDDDPGMPSLLFTQAAAYGNRYQRLGDLDDINQAIEYAQIAINLTPDHEDPRLPRHLINLGILYNNRFERLGSLVDLEQAIEHQSYALALAPENYPYLPAILDGLGASQTRRFERIGGLNDLNNAIVYQSRAVSMTPYGDPDLPMRLTNLGISYRVRFQRLGELNDLESAIDYESRALTLAPEDHPGLPYVFMSLASSHGDRSMRQGGLKDLETAIEYLSHAIALTPDGHPHLPSRLANLGEYYSRRFQFLGELRDLELAIEYQSHALALTPSGNPNLPTIYAHLAVSHQARFQQEGEPNDLEMVVKYETLALSLTPEDHPDSADWQHNYAATQLLCYQRTGDISHLKLSLDVFRRASNSSHAPPHKKFKIAQAWAEAAAAFDPMEAYQTAIDLLPQVVWLGATTNKRYEDLVMAGTLAADAASAAIRFSKYDLALEWLEHTRCVVWNQILMLRSPLDQLMSVNYDLATQLQTVATQLHGIGFESRGPRAVASGMSTAEQVVQEHHQLANDFNDLLVQIRQLEGFEDFVQPMKVHDLVRAARTGPVVVINGHKERCDALIVRPGDNQVHHIALPSFPVQKAQQVRREIEKSLQANYGRGSRTKIRPLVEQVVNMEGVLATLWHNIVKPILEFLGFMPQSRVFDFVISSYSPTLTALLRSTPISLSTDCRVLAIGQAATPGHSPLPGTEQEIAYIRAHTEGKAKYTQLLNHQATVPSVLDAMEQHDWVHLACHAHQNVMDPTKSGFELHDGTLDLAAINRRSFKGKGLAFLSACQTATGDEKLADEAVHLASGMLMAGYTSVIATMWSVQDQDTPLVADKVYAQLMKDRRLGNGEAGRALHHAVACLRGTIGEELFERWVPFIHVGS